MTSPSRPLALVTGASSGIGERFARRYAREGFDLVLVARSGPALRALADDLSSRHDVSVDVRIADLSDPSDVDRLAAAVADADELPRLDHLVNCAGVSIDGDLATTDESAVRRMVDLNVTALTLLSRAAIVRMRAVGAGTIVNVASAAAYQPMPHLAAYAASKSYVLMLTEALSEENRAHGLRILAVSPGDTETPMNPGAASNKRSPEHVVDTAWKALDGRRTAVVDGAANSALATVSSRLLPRRARLRIAERMMRDRA